MLALILSIIIVAVPLYMAFVLVCWLAALTPLGKAAEAKQEATRRVRL